MLGFIARHGRWCLVAGLIAGLSLPELTRAVRPWLPHLIAALLFVSACRIGRRAAVGSLSDLGGATLRVLLYQLAAPLAAIALLDLAGLAGTPAGLAAVLVLAAPSVTGAPNFTILMGRDPTRAMRLLLIGTALFPLTVVPVLLALPILPGSAAVMESAARLLAVIAVAVGLGFAVRGARLLSAARRDALDGVAALLLFTVVLGLMAEAGPALKATPGRFALWLGFAMALNFGLQLAARAYLPKTDAGSAVVAGNRNIALFLVALPPEIMAELLLFIGCYQVPMYLTPLVMRRWLAR